jgi:hypothetical protein
MSYYRFKRAGAGISSLEDVERAFRAFSQDSIWPIDKCAIELHTRSFAAIDRIIGENEVPLLSFFGWQPVAAPEIFKSDDFVSVNRARIAWKNFSLSVGELYRVPWYDWDEKRANFLTLGFVEAKTLESAQSSGALEANPEIYQRLWNLAKNPIDPKEFHTNQFSSGYGNGVRHYYAIVIERKDLHENLIRISRGLGIENGAGGFEFQATKQRILEIFQSGRFRCSDFPSDIDLRCPWTDPVFSIQPGAFHNPVINSDLEGAFSIAKRINNTNQGELINFRILRRFLAWKTPEGNGSPRVSGNYLEASFNGKKWMLYVGVEQFADEDPPVRVLLKPLREIASSLGGHLSSP